MSHTRMQFKDLLESLGSEEIEINVYGQDPGNVTMTYPAVKYQKDQEDVDYADNLPYYITDRYTVTCIETDPNTPIAKLVRELPMCSFNRFYVAENLNHTVYNIFY